MFADWTKIPTRKDFPRGVMLRVYVDTDYDFLYRDKESGVLRFASVDTQGKVLVNFDDDLYHGHWFGTPSADYIDGKAFEVVLTDADLTEAQEHITMLSRKLKDEE